MLKLNMGQIYWSWLHKNDCHKSKTENFVLLISCLDCQNLDKARDVRKCKFQTFDDFGNR